VIEAIEAILTRPEHQWFEETKKAKDLDHAAGTETVEPTETEVNGEEPVEETTENSDS